jgi:hypothetical protein
MNIIEKLPDDIILYIYTKSLKRYRMCEGKLIKLIDFDKYKFLEKYIYRKITEVYGSETNYHVKYKLSNLSEINRKNSFLEVEDDMICVHITVEDGLLRYSVDIFRLKKIKDFNMTTQPLPSIYYKGDYGDCDWEVVSYTYEI